MFKTDITIEPNRELKYSNLGYALVGKVIAVASGQPYASYIEENIIRRLNLISTYSDFKKSLARRMAMGYGSPFNRNLPALSPRISTKALASAIGIHATVEDMCRFAVSQFFGNDTLVNDRLKKEAQRTQTNSMSGRDFGMEFGLGYRIQRVGGRRLIGHDGHLAGHVTATFFDPDAKLAVSIASNAKDAPILQITNGIFEAIDWFARNSPAKKSLAKFNTRLRSDTGSVEIITGRNSIVATDPDSWRPFNMLEELERVDSKTLRIITATSTFQTGELVSYQFEKNVIRAVRYAGLTMVPESGYVGRRLGGIQLPKSDYISMEDVQYATLKVGKIRSVELVRGRLPIRLQIDFGPKYSSTFSYLRAFPEGVSKDTIINKFAVGALFPVWWLGKTTYRVLTIGLSLGGQESPYYSTNNLISLLADTDYPRVVTPKAGNQLAQEYLRDEKSELFKLQALTDYPIEDYIDGAESFSAWRKGHYIKSKSLFANYLNDPPYWLQLGTQK